MGYIKSWSCNLLFREVCYHKKINEIENYCFFSDLFKLKTRNGLLSHFTCFWYIMYDILCLYQKTLILSWTFFLSTACSTSSRALLEAVNEVYEPEWGGKELLTVNSQSVELLWNDFAHRLAEQVLIPLNTYQVCDVMWW